MTAEHDRRIPAVGVVGGGTLGITVAHAALAAGSPVVLLVRDRVGDGAAVLSRRNAIADSLQREVGRGAIAGPAAATLLDALRVTTDPVELAGLGVVVEAVPEDLATKQAVLAELEDHVSPTCLVASATSGIPAAWLAARARHPERIVVAHYVWPAHRMPLVEVALHHRTSADARAALDGLLRSQGKTAVRVADRPGFLITRALLAYWDEAVRLVAGGLEPTAVDQALEVFGFPLGPLRMMDRAGLTTAAAVHEQLLSADGHLFTALSRLRAVTNAGLPGFYAHTAAGRDPNPRRRRSAARGGSVPRPLLGHERGDHRRPCGGGARSGGRPRRTRRSGRVLVGGGPRHRPGVRLPAPARRAGGLVVGPVRPNPPARDRLTSPTEQS